MPSFLLHTIRGIVQNKDLASKVFALLKDGTHMVKITYQGVRSLSQNAYFHGVVCPRVLIGLRDAGWNDVQDEEDAKEFMKKLFLTRKISNPETDEEMTWIMPTHKLTKEEFSQFIDEIIQWAAEYLGIQIPYPNEYLRPYG